MAEQQNWIQERVSNAGGRFRDWLSNIIDHPVQAIGRGVARVAGTVVGGPVGGAAAGRAADAAANWYNRNQFEEGAQQFQSDTGARLNDQIWGQWQPQSSGQAEQPTQGGQSNLAQMLGVVGRPANSYLTGQFSPGQLGQRGPSGPLINMNYGQNPQEYQSEGGGLPGITGPNIHWTQASANAANAGGGPSSVYSGQSGASTSLGAGGRTVGTATMSDIENMLNSGVGRDNRSAMMTQSREVNQDRSQMNAAGFRRMPGETVQQYRDRATQAGII